MFIKLITTLSILTSFIFANEVKIINVKANCTVENICHFDVTLKHEDSGWKHYANKWTISTKEGKVLGSRILYHPHVNEQPFTRSLWGLKIPHYVKEVYVKAYDTVHLESSHIYEYKLK